MTPFDIAWLAGIIEGEGSFTIRPGGVQLKVAMTDRDVVERMHAVAGVGFVNGPYISKRGNRKPLWRWDVHRSPDVARILLAIAPLMGERRRGQIEAAADKLAVTKPKNGPIPHGTNAGWVREHKAGLVHCETCVEARRADHRRQYLARKNAAANRDGSAKGVESNGEKPAEAPANA